MHGLDKTRGQVVIVLVVFIGALDDLVIDIGNIAYIGDIITPVAQIARDRIKNHQHPCVSEMAQVVHRHAADIHFHSAFFNRLENFLFTGLAVVDF